MRTLLVVAVMILAESSFGFAQASTQPNIVFIMADDLGYGDLGCYGQAKIETPSIDRLAKQGMRFTQHYAGSAVCAPSRCILLTGKHAGHAAIRGNDEWPKGADVWKDRTLEGQRPLPASEVTVAELLQQAGYETACIGKWGLGTSDTEGNPNEQGFDHFFGYLCQRQAHTFYPTHLWRNGTRVPLPGNQTDGFYKGDDYSHDLLTQEALDFIKRPHEQPYFLYVPYTIPHVALQVPEDSLSEYRDRWEDPPYEGKLGYTPHETPRAAYAAMITRMDRDVGRLVAAIEEGGDGKNTLIVFTSDNGPTWAGGADSEFFRSTGDLRGLKGSLYEGGIRVPFIARWTGTVPAGVDSDHISAFCDVLPTLTELAVAKTPTDVDGVSLVSTLLGTEQLPAKRALYWELNRQQAVRENEWKIVRRWKSDGSHKSELFQLEIDPAESNDVSAKRPEVARRLAEMLDTMRVESNVKKWQLQ